MLLKFVISNSVLIFQNSEWINVAKAEFGVFFLLKYKVWELAVYAKPLLMFNNNQISATFNT